MGNCILFKTFYFDGQNRKKINSDQQKTFLSLRRFFAVTESVHFIEDKLIFSNI